MSKYIPDAIMDAALTVVASSTRMDVVSDVGTPADLTNSMANVGMIAGDGNDFVIADGDAGNGSRKVTIAAKAGISVLADGTPLHVVLSLDGTINLVTTCSGPDLTTGSTVDFPVWEYELGIPT